MSTPAGVSHATLVCVPEEDNETNLRVARLELAACAPLIGDTAVKDTVEIELKWPAQMVDELAAFYDKTYVNRPPDYHPDYSQSGYVWNCHIFGAAVTGNTQAAQLNKWYGLENAVPGRVMRTWSEKPGQLGGFFGLSGKPVHTVVTAGEKGYYLNVQGLMSGLYYSDRKGLAEHYSHSGKLRTYRYTQDGPAGIGLRRLFSSATR